MCGASRRCVTAIEKGMDKYLAQSSARCQFQHGVDMIFMAMHPAGRQQPHDMQRSVMLLDMFNSLHERRIAVKAPVLNGCIYPRELLIHHAACADIEMANFRVTHLALRKAYR